MRAVGIEVTRWWTGAVVLVVLCLAALLAAGALALDRVPGHGQGAGQVHTYVGPDHNRGWGNGDV